MSHKGAIPTTAPMRNAFYHFRLAVLGLIAQRQARLGSLQEPDPKVVAELGDLETHYFELLGKSSPAEKWAIGEFWHQALEVFGSAEDILTNYPDASGLLYWLRFEAGRRHLMEGLRLAADGGAEGHDEWEG